MTPAVPRQASEISDAWLAGVVPDWPRGAVRVERIGAERGIGGVVIRVRADTGRSVIVKLPIPGERRSIGSLSREARVYAHLGGGAGLRMPDVFHATSDADAPVIVLGDVGHLRQGDDVAGCSLEDAHRAVAELGRFHRRWSDPADLAQLVADDVAVSFTTWWEQLADRVADGVPAARDRARRLAGDQGASVVDALADRFDEVVALGQDPVTLVHRDFRLDNLFFDGDGIVVVDWANPSVGRGAIDLGGFIGRCLTIDPTDADVTALIATYTAAFGDAPPDVEADVRRGAWYWLGWAVLVLTTMTLEAGPRAVVETWIRRLTPLLHRTL